ncbi:MAG TPA: hypothetical protein VLO09_01785, partial [Ornithinimicrobium sp.]|nr:hypothetical protein [Ornithinimicrobium sp.]
MSEETTTPGEERAQDRVENPDDRAGRLAEITAELTARSQEQDEPDEDETDQGETDQDETDQDPAEDPTSAQGPDGTPGPSDDD